MQADPVLTLRVVWEFGWRGGDAPPSGHLWLRDDDGELIADDDGELIAVPEYYFS